MTSENGLGIMTITDLTKALDLEGLGRDMYGLIEELYPICRSITGNGLRQTMSLIQQHIPLTIHEVPTGTQVFDWTVPKEWNIRDAYVKDSKGERIIDFRRSNLHVMSYSVPIRKTVSLKELREHLFTLADHPEWIPYRSSYYDERWGFCLSHQAFLELKDDRYDVCIDSSLQDGHLTYGEYYLPGSTSDEVLLSCHACHPSMCNDNLSGVALVTLLATRLARASRRYSYRFLFIPAVIGAITWLARNEHRLERIKHGLVVANVGDPGPITYKKSREGNAEIDRATLNVLKHSRSDYDMTEFTPYGGDERQFCAPAFNLPVGCFTRTPPGRFPQSHTSADDLTFVQPQCLSESFAVCLSVLDVLEGNRTYLNTNPKCEPQLGRRGLYRTVGGDSEPTVAELAILWVLNLSDGHHTLLDISERSGITFSAIRRAADVLLEHGLLKEWAK